MPMAMKTVHPVTSELVTEPLDPSSIVSGDPVTSALVLAEDEDKGEEAGFWRCEPGVFRDTEVAETFLVITGRAVIEFATGETVAVKPGDIHRFHGGEETVWKVEETLLKAYWART